MSMKKEKILFYLSRHLRAAEDRAKVDQEELARQGKNYSERLKRTEESDGAMDEREALQIAYDFVRDHYFNGNADEIRR